MRTVVVVGLVAGMLLLVGWSAEATPPSQAEETDHSPSEGGYLSRQPVRPAYLSILDVIGKLIVALLVAYALLHGIRWWQSNRMGGGAEAGMRGRQMKLEETLSLGADGRLHLIEVDGRRMLLASQPEGIQQVADLTDEPPRPSAYRSVRERADGSTDEVNVVQSRTSTRPIRPDVVEESEQWEKRRNRLLAELQEHD